MVDKIGDLIIYFLALMHEQNSLIRKHHPYSPSSLQSREACPKFIPADGPVHEMAITGTMQHDSVDSQLDDPRLPDYRAMAVAQCLAFMEERQKLYPGGKTYREEYLPIDDEWVRVEEDRVIEFTIVDPDTGLEAIGFRKERVLVEYQGTTAGYADVAIISADKIASEIIDWKFGNNAVEGAENNVQGIAYALGLLKKFPRLIQIRVWFIMPHLDHVSEHTFTKTDFGGMMLRIRTIVKRAQEAHKNPEDFSYARPNVGSCLFCGLIGRCPKVAETVINLGKKYNPLEIPDEVNPSLVLDSKQVAVGIRLAQVVQTWAEAFKRQATAKTIADPNFIPEGYVLVSSQKRKVKNAKELGELAKTYLPDADKEMVEGLYDIAITAVEKLISTAAPRGKKESTVDEFSEKALEAGALEQGSPFAFLRQARKTDSGKVVEGS